MPGKAQQQRYRTQLTQVAENAALHHVPRSESSVVIESTISISRYVESTPYCRALLRT